MSMILSDTQTTLNLLSEISPTIRDYLDAELYRGNIENVHEFTPELLLSLCVPLLIKELKILGLTFSISVTDLLSEKDNIDACIALREFFESDTFKNTIKDSQEMIKCCHTLFQSQDIPENEYVKQMIELIEMKKLGDQFQIKRINPVLEYLDSDSSFVDHITAILQTCNSRSKITEDSMLKYSKYATEVIQDQLILLHNAITNTIRADNDLVLFFGNNVSNRWQMTQEYIKTWTDLEYVEECIWLSNVTEEDLKDPQTLDIVGKIHDEIFNRAIFGIKYYNFKTIDISELEPILIHLTIVNMIRKSPSNYPRLRYLIDNPHEDESIRILEYFKHVLTEEQITLVLNIINRLAQVQVPV